MTALGAQELIVALLVAAAALWLLLPVGKALLMTLARALLRRGRVKWAMRVRGLVERQPKEGSSSSCH